MFSEIKAPNKYELYQNTFSIFLAGSIDMGNATNWQNRISQYVRLIYGDDHEENGNYHFTVLNPRRDNWDNSQKCSADNPYFAEQVNWELNALDAADLIVMYLDPNSVAPISLLELGIHNTSNIVVCCPDGYFRQANVEIVCGRFGIPYVTNLNDLEEMIDQNIETKIPYYYITNRANHISDEVVDVE